jgi:uncharacterized membrane protein
MIRRHARFLIALGAGLAVLALALAAGLPATRAILPAADALFLCHLALCVPLLRLTPEDLRRRAASADEGAVLIFLLAALAIGISLWAIFLALSRASADPLETALALAALPLGWATLNTLAALHYAHLYHAPEPGGPHGGLSFPGTPDPGMPDFLYFAFTVGMTAQVSDVVVTSPVLRRAVLVHGIAAFATNTVILALAVNAAAG